MLIGNRRLPWYGSAPTPLHPSQIDFGAPFLYHKDLWTETLTGIEETGTIGPEARGIKLEPNGDVNAVASIQAVQTIEVADGKRSLLAARILVDHPISAKVMLGLWPTGPDPFSSRPENGIFVEDPGSGAGEDEWFGTSIANGDESSTEALLGGPGDPIVFDLAVLIDEMSAVSFCVRYASQEWYSGVLTTNIPSEPMRPSIATQRGNSNHYIVVKSFYAASES